MGIRLVLVFLGVWISILVNAAVGGEGLFYASHMGAGRVVGSRRW